MLKSTIVIVIFCRRVVFIVPTRLLVEQQARAISQELGIRVYTHLGGQEVPSLLDSVWVLVSTPASFRQLSKNDARFDIATIDLLFLDEVHHATVHFPIRCLILQYSTCHHLYRVRTLTG